MMKSKSKIQMSNVKVNPNIQIQNPNVETMSVFKYQNKVNFDVGVKKYDLRERLIDYAKQILIISGKLPKTIECDVIRRQLSSSATSIGANYEEADGAITKKDFLSKISISRKEANETAFWLKVISDTYLRNDEVENIIQEAREIKSILSSIINKIRDKKS